MQHERELSCPGLGEWPGSQQYFVMNISTGFGITVGLLASSCLVLLLRPDLLAGISVPIAQATAVPVLQAGSQDKTNRATRQGDRSNEIRKTIADLALPATRERAKLRLVEIGRAAIPFLLSTLKNNNESIREMSLNGLRLLHAAQEIATALNDKSPQIRILAITSLSSLGKPGFHAMLEKIGDWETKEIELVQSLIRESPVEAIPLLIAELGGNDARIRDSARLLLKGLSPINAFADALRHEKAEVRKIATQELKAQGEKALPALDRLIEHKDQRSRRLALQVLTAIGPQASRSIGELVTDETLGLAAARILIDFGKRGVPFLSEKVHELDAKSMARLMPLLLPKLKSNTQYLLRCLNNESEMAGRNAAEMLVLLRRKAAIVKALVSARPVIRRHLVKSVGTMGEEGIPILELAVQNPDQQVRRIAFDALVKLNAAKSIAKVLVGRSTELRTLGIVALIQLGEAGIQSLAETPGFADGNSLGFALDELKKHKRKILPELEEALNSRIRLVYRTSFRLLEKCEAFEVLLRALGHERSEIRQNARQALLRIGPRAVRKILTACRNEPLRRDSICLDLLRAMGGDAVPEIMKALNDKELRAIASEVLRVLVSPSPRPLR